MPRRAQAAGRISRTQHNEPDRTRSSAERLFGVSFTEQGMGKLLRRVGFSFQRPDIGLSFAVDVARAFPSDAPEAEPMVQGRSLVDGMDTSPTHQLMLSISSMLAARRSGRQTTSDTSLHLIEPKSTSVRESM